MRWTRCVQNIVCLVRVKLEDLGRGAILGPFRAWRDGQDHASGASAQHFECQRCECLADDMVASSAETNGQARAKCALVVIVPCSALSRLGLPYQARPLPSHYSPLVSSAFSESKLTTDADIIRTPNAYDDVDQKLRSRIV